jgi:hypothetical protein
MRCLHCGNEVSLLQKLSDAQFCSAEHRQQFYDDQQRLIMQRLQASAARLQDFRGGSRHAGGAVRIGGPSADVVAPAPIAPFFKYSATALQRALSLLMVGALDAPETRAILPVRAGTAARFRSLERPLFFDFPWAKYNPGLLSFPEIAPAGAEFDLISVALSRTTPIRDWGGLSAAALVPIRRPGALNAPRVRLVQPVTPSWDLLIFLPDLDSDRLRLPATSRAAAMPGLRDPKLASPQPAEPASRVLLSCRLVPLIIDPAVTWTGLRLDTSLRQRGMGFLDRVFRMRARGGVLSPKVPAFLPNEPNFDLDEPSAPARLPARTAGKTAPGEPSRLDKLFRTRPFGARDSVSHATFFGILAESVSASAAAPAVLATFTGQTERVVRSSATPASLLFAPAPFTGSLQDRIAAEQLDGPANVARPYSPARPAEAEPVPSDRFLEGQPRRPAADETLASYKTVAGAVPMTADMPRLPSRSGSLVSAAMEPAVVDRLFRMRARNGVAGAKINGLPVNAAAEPLLGAPVKPGTTFETDAAPAAIARMYRPRPRGPVPSPVDPSPETIETGSAESLTGAPAVPSSGLPGFSLSPPPFERMFRMRPRSGVAYSRLAGMESGTAGEIESQSGKPVLPASPISSTACAPRPVVRLYRARLRGPVAGAQLDSYQQIEPVSQIGFVSQFAHPQHEVGAAGLSPGHSDRLFRMRPGSGVGSGSDTETRDILTAPQPAGVRPDYPASPAPGRADFEPPIIQRPFRMRPRSGIRGGADRAEITVVATTFACRPTAGYSVRTDFAPLLANRTFRARLKGPVDGQASIMSPLSAMPVQVPLEPTCGSYVLRLGSGAAPAFLNRAYRIRPRVPVQDPKTLMAAIRFKHLAIGEPDAVFPTLPMDIIEDPQPASLDRLYRMRPRSGKTGAAEKLAIGCEAIAGDSTPEKGSLQVEDTATAAKDALRSFSKNWKATSMGFKSMVMLVPVLLFLAFSPFGADQSSVAHANTLENGSLHNAVSAHLGRVGQEIRGRAAIAVEDDFSSGLVRWIGADGWQQSWSTHQSGWIKPGKLALLAPSVPLSNYRLEFSGQIVSNALGFVVRAADLANYHAIKFKISRHLPTPSVTVVRTTVIAGKEVSRKEIPLPFTASRETVYRVSVDANDESFTLMVQDKVVDCWSDAQLKSGGVGFFSEKGEESLINTVRVRHQYDTLGRLVAAALPAER